MRNIYYKVATSPVDRGDSFNSYERALNAFINESNAITNGVDEDLVIKDNMSNQIVINILDKPSIVINDSNILLKETTDMINKLLEEKEEVGVICYHHMIHSTEVLGEEVKLMQVELYDLYDPDAFESYKDLKAIAMEGKQGDITNE